MAAIPFKHLWSNNRPFLESWGHPARIIYFCVDLCTVKDCFQDPLQYRDIPAPLLAGGLGSKGRAASGQQTSHHQLRVWHSLFFQWSTDNNDSSHCPPHYLNPNFFHRTLLTVWFIHTVCDVLVQEHALASEAPEEDLGSLDWREMCRVRTFFPRQFHLQQNRIVVTLSTCASCPSAKPACNLVYTEAHRGDVTCSRLYSKSVLGRALFSALTQRGWAASCCHIILLLSPGHHQTAHYFAFPSISASKVCLEALCRRVHMYMSWEEAYNFVGTVE